MFGLFYQKYDKFVETIFYGHNHIVSITSEKLLEMAFIRIMSDIRSLLYIDGKQLCILQPNVIHEYQISLGDHFVNVISVYNDKLRYNRVVSVLHDQALIFNFSELIRDNMDLLNDLELFRYEHENKYGFFEPITRSVVIEPQYDKCGHFSKQGFAIAEKNNLKGVIDKKGEIVIPFEYDYIYESSHDNKLFQVNKGNNVGYIDHRGQIRIEMQSNPVCFVRDYQTDSYFGYYYKQNEYSVLYNNEDKVIICGLYDSFSLSSDYILASQGHQKFVFTKSGELLFSCDYSDLDYKYSAFKVCKQFSQNQKYGIVDLSGRCIVPLEYDYIYSFQNGFFLLKKEGAPNRIVQYDGVELKERLITSDYGLGDSYFIKKEDHYVILIDIRRDAEYRIECEGIRFLDGDYSGDNPDYLMIERPTNNKWLSNKYGLLRISYRLDYLTECEYDTIYKFHNGYACVKQGISYGAIDMRGNLVVPCTYAYEFAFNEDGYAEVYKVEPSDSWISPYNYLGYGIINSANKTIIGFDKYQKIYWERFASDYKFNYPVVRLEKDGTSYLIDYSNNIVSTYGPEYHFQFFKTCACTVYIESVENGKSLYGYVDKFGHLVIQCKFDDIKKLKNDLLACKLNGKYAIFGSDGCQITGHLYEDIDCDISYDNDGNELSENIQYMIARKESGYGVIDKRGIEILDFVYSHIETYYKNEPFDVDINTLLEWDTGDDGEAYAILGATKEGPFRYDIAYARKALCHRYELYGVDKKPVILRKLGDPISAILPTSNPITVKGRTPFEGFGDLFAQDNYEKVVKLAGVTYGDRQLYISELKTHEKLELRREKNNVFDSNAVAVHDSRGRHIGYIPKADAVEIAQRLDKGETLKAHVLERLGGIDFNFGLKIKITN